MNIDRTHANNEQRGECYAIFQFQYSCGDKITGLGWGLTYMASSPCHIKSYVFLQDMAPVI